MCDMDEQYYKRMGWQWPPTTKSQTERPFGMGAPVPPHLAEVCPGLSGVPRSDEEFTFMLGQLSAQQPTHSTGGGGWPTLDE